MKRFLIIFAVLLMSSSDSPFCEGYEDGYVAGYCYRIFGCQSPIVPNCPLPEIDENTYTDGYNKGFVHGRQAKENE